MLFFRGRGEHELPFCVGLLLAGDEAVTAAHCFAREGAIDHARAEAAARGSREAPVPLHLDGSLAVLVGEPGEIREVGWVGASDGLTPVLNALALDTDILKVRLLGLSLQSHPEPFRTAAARKWDKLLFLVTDHVTLDALRQVAAARSEKGAALLGELVRVDPGPACAVVWTGGSCVYHACQTVEGLSGTPLLTEVDGSFTLVGVHNGGNRDPQRAPCGFFRADFFPNYGTAIARLR